jgi:nicotinate-nucleotide pyrophosphorylase
VMKYAVRVGGAHNHIFNLRNGSLVKDNHIKIAGSIKTAIEILRSTAQHTFKIEVECETLERSRRHSPWVSRSSCSTTWTSTKCAPDSSS